MKPFSHHSFSGPTEIPPVNTSKELGHGAWGILSGSNSYRPSNDASLFSSSLPVLPHAKLNLNETEGSRYISSEDDLSSDLEKIHLNVKGSAPMDEMKALTIGNSLPGDEDELLAGIADDFDLSGLPGSLADLGEYDFFDSGGGMELESDVQDSHRMSLPQVNLSDNALGSGLANYAAPNGSATVAGEHPYGEHPSRTLFVRNINSNVEDSELKSLFEQYGDIRTLYTACKHRGFVMITYYDIRDARTAMRALQNKPLRRRKLDIHFSIPKDNPSDKDVNQGTLVVFNLDPSVSNEDLRLIFGTYGEVKEIRETPHKRHHKFVEYYDARAAEAALKSLNRIDIAGKRIKLEPSRPGGARRNLMLQLNQDLEQEESRSFRPPAGSPVTNSPPGNWLQFSSPIEHNPLHNISKSPNFTSLSPTTSSNLPGLAALLHPQLSNVVKVLPIGKDQSRGSSHLEQLLNSANSSQASSFQQSNSFPEPKLSQFHGSLPSFGPPSASNGSKVETLSGPQFLWGSPKNSESVNPAWTRTVRGHQFATTTGAGKGQVFPLSGHHGSFFGSSSNQNRHHHHVGSAPSGVPLDRRFNFFPESPETSILNSAMYGNINMGLGRSDGKLMANMANMAPRAAISSAGFSIPGNMSENSSLNYKMMSSPRLSPVFLGNGLYPGLHQTSIDGFSEHGRSKRMETNGSMVDSKKQFQLDLDRIVSGEDMRTTLMIKNIPNKYTSKMLLAAIDENHKSTYDFLYLPIDFKNKCNVGYAFINMLSPSHIIPFYEAFNGKKWEKFNSEKVALLAYARIQGKTALVTHFQNSSLMNEDKRCRPILFYSEGSSDFDEVILEHLPSNSLNIQVSQPNGSLSSDFSGSPSEHNFHDVPGKS